MTQSTVIRTGPGTNPGSDGSRLLAPAVSAGIALLIYAVTLGGTYIYDDVVDIHDDGRLTVVHQWPTYFTTSYNGGVDNLFRPLVSLSFAIQTWMGGHVEFWLHAVNWLLQAAVSALVAVLAGRLYRNATIGLIAGVLFAALPIHVEAVAGLVGRSELMCAVGILGALVILLGGRITTARAFAASGCLILALGSKEQGILLPLIAAVMAISLGIRPKDERERQSMLALIALGCMLTAGYMAYRESILKFEWDRSFLDWTEQPMVRCQGWDRWLVPIALVGRYASLIVWPADLSIDYGGRVIGWHTSANDPYLWIGVLVLVAWVVAVVAAWRWRQGAPLFCLLGLGITYALVSNFFVIIGTNFGERLMYLPSVFLCALVGGIIIRLPRPAVIGLTAALVIAGGVRSFAYARQWNDRYQFYQTQSAAHPRSVRLEMLLADEASARGDFAVASEADRRGREAEPDYVQIWIQSGNIAIKQGKLGDAQHFLQRAMQIDPHVASGWMAKVTRLIADTQPADKH